MKSKINSQEIILKQKEQEEKKRKNKLNEIKKEIDKIKRENLQQTKNSNIEKENNMKTKTKKCKDEKNTLEKQVTDLKTLNLYLETNLHRQKNKEIQQTEQLAISRQPTYRTDQERERKENKKNTEIGRNTQKNMLCM